MKTAIFFTIAILALVQTSQAASIFRNPANITMNFEINRNETSRNSTVMLYLTSNDPEIYDNLNFSSEYLMEYFPAGTNLQPQVETAFTLIIGVKDITKNTTIATEIMITGESTSGRINLTSVPLTINVNAQLGPLENYIYKKCFVENDETYCTDIDISKLQNVTLTVINITQDNYTYNIMIPFETAQEFFQKYDISLNKTVVEMKNVAESVSQQTNKTLNLQEEKEMSYRNAFMIENFMKKESNPVWFEIEPVNSIINMTGLTPQQFSNAIGVLFESGKIIQRFEEVWQTTPLPNGGIVTIPLRKSYMASSDRLQQFQVTTTSLNIVIIAMASIILSLAFISMYEFRWKKMPRLK